ncbi:MAG: tRNA (adenosine(37)-N6)-dimethylallyltransferase MiaA [Oscillospiraceae bacterium]|jgi:tRNA dimethylallyltransferase
MPSNIMVITGPTATGKTALGILLAKEFNGEVVSADSMQIYQRMNIGTAKPTPEEMGEIPHHMIDIVDPAEPYSVAQYVSDASHCVDNILSRGKLPIVVGGTGLYIDSLISGRTFADHPGNPSVRQTLLDRYDAIGGEAMRLELAKVDPERAEKLHPRDKRRIIRALEVFQLTGKTITQHDKETRELPPRYHAAQIALTFADRTALYERIDRRVDCMVEAGLFDEVRTLLAEGLDAHCTAMQAIGYKEVVRALNGELRAQEAIDLIKQESRRYAKRQLTWLRRNPDLCWIRWEGQPNFEKARQSSTSFAYNCGIQ